MSQKVELESLTAEQKEQIYAEMQAKETARQNAIKEERKVYKETKDITVSETIAQLQNISSFLSEAKAGVFNNFAALIGMKKELYDYKDGQQSHSFTNALGQSIEIGFRTIDGWDDTVEAGIAKVNEYIDSLATNDETARLVRGLQRLLKKDKDGNLKSNRVIELENMADEFNHPLFVDGVKIIREAYKPVRSAYFIEASYKDETGKKQSVPLSITSVDFPVGTEVNLSSL
ncbi:MAG: DUF3164 family protein [Carboxylicivirga sp.]|jgi:hypothetical protein|nr:DUF3164 family protein [Carboxylicivirga sp.]